MIKYLLPILLCVSTSAFADEHKVEIKQKSEQLIYEGALKCQTELSTGTFQQCNLILNHNDKPLEGVEVFIDGGMPEHEHGLPTSPKINWSDEKGFYMIEGLKFSMPGDWVLTFKINHQDEKLKDFIAMKIQVKA